MDNDTFELSHLSDGRTIIGGRCVYAVKLGPNDEEQFKARYVANGYFSVINITYLCDVHYCETFSQTARITSVRKLIQLAVQHNWTVHQMDVKAAYLNASYILNSHQALLRQMKMVSNLVLKLKRSLYGLKQSGRNWNNMLHEYLIGDNFDQSLADRRRRSCASPVLTAIGLVNGNPVYLTPTESTSLNRSLKNLSRVTTSTTSMGGFWVNR